MPRRVEKHEDNWYGVSDPKKRKQIQDRLAQRARRLRLAEQQARKDFDSSSSDGSLLVVVGSPKRRNVTSSFIDPRLSRSLTLTNSLSNSFPTPPIDLSRETTHIPLPYNSHDICAALFHNGLILQIPCSSTAIACSKPALVQCPPSLIPSQLQLTIVHFQWIDRFPLPRMRDRMIELEDQYSAEDFLGDLFTGAAGRAFVMKEGGKAWDEASWGVGKGFRRKWWFLFE
ncbi:hypothetical protein BJ875DRAFT_402796 [Amylocarpus encephaloides]|uniref:BZIP domain-containing protein n=1 Tax=Amylocarpus encephaloides TaxID=45428 RepID=A0A9P7YH92_9HELO|nr:hypothetical protein BJ875DRAFT_402796 [Amylocarpus encephaloides]